MTRPKLSPRQEELLSFITSRIVVFGSPPSHREMATGMGIKSTNAVEEMIRALEDKGYVTRARKENGRRGARSIRIHALPNTVEQHATALDSIDRAPLTEAQRAALDYFTELLATALK
jgi:repressor LexA